MNQSKRMHVLIIPSWYPENDSDIGGSFFREQARALHEAGLRVGVIAPRSLSLRQPRHWIGASRAVSAVDDDGVQTLRSTAIEWFGRVPSLGPRVWIARGLSLYRRYVREHGKPDVLHAHSLLNGGLLAREISRSDKVPYVVTEHRSSYVRGLVPTWKLALARQASIDASARIAVSEAFARFLGDLFGLGTGSWRFIPNIVHARFFEGPMGGVSAGESNSFRFCNIGMMSPIKGQVALVRAFYEAFLGDKRVSLVIAGDGPLRDQLHALTSELGIAEQVQFTGKIPRDQIVRLLRNSSAFVSSSESETFGVAAAEALAMGLPVIATRTGGLESVLRDGDGILVPTYDHNALVRGLRELCARRAQYVPEELRERCAARFSGPVVAGQLLDIYHSLV